METSILSRPELVWFILGLVLFLLELVIPGFVIFFFGLGAWITALLCLIAEPGINVQALVFAITSVISLIAFRRFFQKKFFDKKPNEVDVDDEFTGKEAVVIEGFGTEKTGKVEFKGTNWNAESDAPLVNGQRVIITSKDSFKLNIKPK